jgi:hypothetical protein
MKFRIAAIVAVIAVSAAAFASVASAASESKLTGKLTSISYDSAKKTGKLHIVSSKGVKTTISLNSDTGCGVSFGQSGDEIPCATLTSAKYKGKTLFVTAKKYSDGHRTASIISADLSH